jgi:hypothetical protein
MSTLTRLGIGLGAVAAALAIGAGTFALMGDDGGGDASGETARNAVPASDADAEVAGGASLGMCAPGVTDCVDVAIDPAGDASRCAADGPGCMEPVPQTESICIDTGDPTAECADTFCLDDGEVPILPATDPSDPALAGVDDPAVDPAVSELVDPAVSEMVDPESSGGGTSGCAPLPDPTPCDIEGGCLPPDCVTSSDGAFECTDPDLIEDLRERAGAGQSNSAGPIVDVEPVAPDAEP